MADFVEHFVSAGANPRSHCLAVSRKGKRIVFASDSDLVLENFPEIEDIGRILSVSQKNHTAQITVVKRIKARHSTDDELFVSGGTDKRVNLWNLNVREDKLDHSVVLGPCKESIASVCGSVADDRTLIAASYAGDGAGFRIWWIREGVQTDYEVPDLGNSFIIAIDSHRLANDTVIIAAGTSLRKIEIYGENTAQNAVSRLISIVGHTDWIHSVAFNDNNDGLLLASAGQDTFVKLWRIENDSTVDDPDELSVTKNKMVVEDSHGNADRLQLVSESVLAGHEDWVHSTEWDASGRCLVTSSSDKSVIVWREINGLWTDDVRLGIVGGQAAGFFSACFGGDQSNSLVASSYFGGLHAWIEGEQASCWEPVSMSGGHVGDVRDVCWDPKGNYLVSVGKDQSTRIIAPVLEKKCYFEIARPQVHGHDMQCVATISSACFVSGAEEKIFRAFEAPQTFVNSLVSISKVDREQTFHGCHIADYGARVPALGLSNKAIDNEESDTIAGLGEAQHWEEAAFQAKPQDLIAPPTEDSLQQNTLWPEVHKLYGHGFEVYAIAVNPSSTVLATTCKASHQDHAALILWDTSDWSRKTVVKGHQLTVTQLEWSPDGKWLISVSRDRTVILYKEKNNDLNGFEYEKMWTSGKEHSRIIWACAWFSDSQHFVTVSRDTKVLVWRLENDGATVITSLKMEQPITDVAVSSGSLSTATVVCGMQDGSLAIGVVVENTIEIKTRMIVPAVTVDSAVQRLRFHPTVNNGSQMLAYAGADGKARIFSVSIDESKC